MTDAPLVAKRLAIIETCLADLERERRAEPLTSDLRQERFVEHTLQIAIQAAIDVASHIVADEKLGEPQSNAQLFDLLARGGWLTGELAATMRKMVGFRNILVHAYDDVDLRVVEDILLNRLNDLELFVRTVRSRMA